ncbi:glycosyltransferase family 4 protein [Eggerthella sinensis]|uniref:glycosyltransferase family 4 protein n=1 Tax=Eggerthella sinensis TaxID=242230 RepID=UPI00248D8425|nr:glycosyltransferase family 4 protein [Eggerthella sinensis]
MSAKRSDADQTIVFFSANYPPHTGGVETYTCNLARTCVAMGYRAVVVCLNNCSAAPYEIDECGVEVFRLPCHSAFKSRYPLANKTNEYRSLIEKLERVSVDYVIVNTRFYPLSLFGVRFARKRSITPIVIEHGSAHLTLNNPLLDTALAGVEHALSAIIKRSEPRFYAVSEAGSAWLRHFGIESSGELHNAIDASSFESMRSSRDYRHEEGIGESELLLVSVGRLVPEKGVPALLAAMDALQDEPIWCLFAGDGPLRASVEQCGLPHVRALGNLNKQDVAALLCQANALCLPSRSEGFATSLLEAAACGTPSIVTRVGGVAELIPNETFGTVLENADATSIERALRTAIENNSELVAQGRRVRQRVSDLFNWQQTAEDALRACEDAQRS